ncbi:hypothetical protein V3F56_14440 [Moorellaceae bacterium AZ2]
MNDMEFALLPEKCATEICNSVAGKDLLAFASWYRGTCREEPAPESITSIDLR